MNNEKKNDFASAMFRKGSNTVELVFARYFNRKSIGDRGVWMSDQYLLDMLLYAYLLGACACLNDQASFIELSQAIDNVWR